MKMTTIEIANKIDWEGSLEYLLLDYGIDPDDVEDDRLAEIFSDLIPLLTESRAIIQAAIDADEEKLDEED